MAGITAQLVLYGGSTLFLRRKYGLRIPLRTGLLTLCVVVSLGLGGIIGATNPALSLEVLAGKVSTYGIFVAGLMLFLSPADRAKVWHLARGVRKRLPALGGLVRC